MELALPEIFSPSPATSAVRSHSKYARSTCPLPLLYPARPSIPFRVAVTQTTNSHQGQMVEHGYADDVLAQAQV